ncbi:MAG TPA: hypothetical protein VFT12_12350 [Thermoanaerobaculia bacterium]|nr:hypothetical protein [Thermoanaerobaculia bacterium]
MTDPRNLHYPGHEEQDGPPAKEPAQQKPEGVERRSGTADEVKELDRVERRKKD